MPSIFYSLLGYSQVFLIIPYFHLSDNFSSYTLYINEKTGGGETQDNDSFSSYLLDLKGI